MTLKNYYDALQQGHPFAIRVCTAVTFLVLPLLPALAQSGLPGQRAKRGYQPVGSDRSAGIAGGAPSVMDRISANIPAVIGGVLGSLVGVRGKQKKRVAYRPGSIRSSAGHEAMHEAARHEDVPAIGKRSSRVAGCHHAVPAVGSRSTQRRGRSRCTDTGYRTAHFAVCARRRTGRPARFRFECFCQITRRANDV